jgi:hypothetical protein
MTVPTVKGVIPMDLHELEMALNRQAANATDDESPPDDVAFQNVKRKGGRPKGARNKRPGTLVTEEKLAALYDRAEPFLDDEMKRYLRDVIGGNTRVDPEREMELLVAYMRLLLSEGTATTLRTGMLTIDLAKFAGELRMGIKDLHDIQRKNRDDKAKLSNDDELVDITSKSALGRFERRFSTPAAGREGRPDRAVVS